MPESSSLGRQPSVRRQMVDHLRQILAETGEQFVARQPALGGQALDLVGAERAWRGRRARSPCSRPCRPREFAVSPWPPCCNWLRRSPSPPLSTAAGRATREQAAEAALEQVTETAATAKPTARRPPPPAFAGVGGGQR